MKTISELQKTTILVPDLSKEQPCKEELVPEEHIMTSDLRKSAIEDVKELRKLLPTVKARFEVGWLEGKINYIMEKFCLTEDDLK